MAKAGRSEIIRQALVACLAPLATLAIWAYMRADPWHVLLFGDPDFGYLFNSLLLLEGITPAHVDHPGTPIQLLGALAMQARYLLNGTEPSLRNDFFLHPVPYQQWTLHSLFAVFLATQWYAVLRLLRLRVPGILAVGAGLIPLTFFDLLDHLGHVSPEALLAAFSLLLVPVLLGAARGGFWPVASTGALLGLVATLKAPALSLVFCGFLVPGLRGRLTFLASAAFVYLGITAPIWSEFPRMLDWYFRLFAHSGVYGQGADSPLSASSLGENVRSLLASGFWNGNLPLLLLFPLLLALPSPSFRRWPLALSSAALLLLVLKHPGTRYLLPIVAPAGLALVRAQSLPRWAQALVLAAAIGPAPFLLLEPVRARASWRNDEAKAARGLEALLASAPFRECNVTTVNDLAFINHALFTGNCATSHEAYGPELGALYPRASFLANQVRFYGQIATLDRWKAYLASAPCHLFVGRPRARDTIRGAFGVEPEIVEMLGRGKNIVVYRVPDPKMLRAPDSRLIAPAASLPLVREMPE